MQKSVSLVLVSAPAGFGKTALLRSLYEQRRDDGEHVIWLSLDAADNDPQRFLEYLDAALEAPAANGGEAPAAASFETVIARVGELTGSDAPFSFFPGSWSTRRSAASSRRTRTRSTRTRGSTSRRTRW